MKKVTIIIFVFSSIIFFFSCTKLEITNNTSFDLDLISWIDEDGDMDVLSKGSVLHQRSGS
ncbi:hypothetical protein LCGC14_3035740 [marine sediment metagenome]|uniref:Uncharacterized protein n=1 Tax=marine sediment metagenome TaxID=412755 RepID=A0A0F8XEC2_9ZZZZ